MKNIMICWQAVHTDISSLLLIPILFPSSSSTLPPLFVAGACSPLSPPSAPPSGSLFPCCFICISDCSSPSSICSFARTLFGISSTPSLFPLSSCSSFLFMPPIPSLLSSMPLPPLGIYFPDDCSSFSVQLDLSLIFLFIQTSDPFISLYHSSFCYFRFGGRCSVFLVSLFMSCIDLFHECIGL